MFSVTSSIIEGEALKYPVIIAELSVSPFDYIIFALCILGFYAFVLNSKRCFLKVILPMLWEKADSSVGTLAKTLISIRN